MSVPKIETDKFDGKSDFVWRRKMKAGLVQNKIAPAICGLEEYVESWKGNIFIKMLDGVTGKLTEVRYVPNLPRNLISLSYLDSLGLSFKSKNGILHVCKGNLVMLKGFKRETLYILIGKMVCNFIALISNYYSRENYVVASKDRPH
ncbi:hypothetical protein M9H77_11551 [Catharanthus roseus]|uniref:Uncharacterized protein n=1 Tax=Catharanthus roseus TaxID=4058 RepID=A0ACC0BF19_CATRO|nr:hypothetical protein M9H77_11551 [Catharanthus roseus]